MCKSIEKVVNLQIEFWTHLSNIKPDFNTLDEIANKMYSASQDAHQYWLDMSQINPAYPPALRYYGEYINIIKNHPQAGREFLDRANDKEIGNQSSNDLIAK